MMILAKHSTNLLEQKMAMILQQAKIAPLTPIMFRIKYSDYKLSFETS